MQGDRSPRPDNPGLILPLTSLRAFAAAYVVVFHYGNSFVVGHAGVPALVRTVLGNGRLGVAFFFVLSGFVLARVYDGKLATGSGLRAYALARVARVYPVYLLALVWTGLLGGPFVSAPGWRWLPQFLGMQSWSVYSTGGPDNWNTPAWTLSAEAFFYLVFPFAMIALRRHGLVVILAALAGLIATIAITGWASLGYERSVPTGMAAHLPLAVARLPEFLYGVALGMLSTRIPPARRLVAIATPLLVVAILMTLTAPADIAAIGVVLLSGLLICALAVDPGSKVGRALSWRPLVLLGGASYSMYILQTPAHETVRLVLGDGIVSRIAFYPILVALSILVFVLVEEPAREFIRKCVSLSRSTGAQIVGGQPADPRPPQRPPQA